jgi:serine/threonine protein kinase
VPDAAVCAEVLSLLAQAHSGDSFLEPRSYELPATAGATLSSGLRIGPYEVVSAIGAGGMGEVYRARDTKLGRDVAIKVLPSAFHTDPDRRARLEREARLLAALNHSHIAAIYGLEESDGVQALVLVVKPKP